jgi:alpha-tubulin suppressor-like RCC1 family protein
MMKTMTKAMVLGGAIVVLEACSSAAIDGGHDGGAGAAGTGGSGGSGGGGPPMGAPIRAKEVAIGLYHACALREDATVVCWGANEQGELGNGSNVSYSIGAIVVPGLADVTQVVAAVSTTCAVLRDGTAKCWGRGDHGQLGNGKQGYLYLERTPVDVQLTGIVDLALAKSAACAVTRDGTASCWGSNDGALGFVSPMCGPYLSTAGEGPPGWVHQPCESSPRAVAGVASAVTVAISGVHQCVLHGDQRVSCWGRGGFGQLGGGDPAPSREPLPPSAPIPSLAAVQVAVGYGHSCALLLDQSVSCWGANSDGQLGIGTGGIETSKARPTAVPRLANVKAIRLAEETTMALLTDGTVQAWGDINYVLKDPPNPGRVSVSSPTAVPAVQGAVGIATSSVDNCVTNADHTVMCWNTLDDDYQVVMQ